MPPLLPCRIPRQQCSSHCPYGENYNASNCSFPSLHLLLCKQVVLTWVCLIRSLLLNFRSFAAVFSSLEDALAIVSPPGSNPPPPCQRPVPLLPHHAAPLSVPAETSACTAPPPRPRSTRMHDTVPSAFARRPGRASI